jgi:hypothetical protein
MRLIRALISATAIAIVLPHVLHAQTSTPQPAPPQKPAAPAEDEDRKVAGGGIKAPGWQGKIDAKPASQGKTINDSKFEMQGKDIHMAIGPAAVYWNPANTANGDYTVSGTFKETKVVSDHPHPAGVFIGGKNLDSDQQSFLYCVVYGGSGNYLVRQFTGPKVDTLAKRQPHAAINKPAADGSVTNEVGWRVKGGQAECLVNGQVVATFKEGETVADAKVGTFDGVYGLRVSHNMDVIVSNLAKK